MRFLTALLMTFLLTGAVLGGGGYVVSQLAIPPMREVFRGPAFEFELAPGWWCQLEETEYVCVPPGKRPHDAIAIFALKERNDKDNLEAYEDHLNKQLQKIKSESKDPSLLEKFYVRRRTIGTRQWIESLQPGTEIENYDTYYLGTNTSYLGILFTLTVHKDRVDRYASQLNAMAETLDVYQR